MKIGKWVLNNFWLKVISLLLAVGTWFYVANLIESSSEKRILAKMLPTYTKMISKKLNVEVVFAGKLPEGYNLVLEDVKVDPPYFVVAGPRFIINNVQKLETLPINISKYRKTDICKAQIAPISKSVDTEKLQVDVTIPIRKINPESTSPVKHKSEVN